MQVRDIMNANVKTAAPTDTFAQVAALLQEHGISSVVVLDGTALAGIVTERDLVNLVSEGADPRITTVGERMTTDLETVGPKIEISEAADLMARLKIRHLPVVAGERLVGIISIRDLTNWAVRELTGGHELPDLQGSHSALSAAAQVNRTT